MEKASVKKASLGTHVSADRAVFHEGQRRQDGSGLHWGGPPLCPPSLCRRERSDQAAVAVHAQTEVP